VEERPFLVEDLEQVLERLAPRAYAEAWDNSGRLVGRRGSLVERVLLALDLTEEVVVEATNDGFQAILTHHPLIFAPLRRVTDQDRLGLLVTQLINADITLVAAHTNLDSAPGGLNDIATEALGLLDTRPLVPAQAGWKKLVGFVPPSTLEDVSRAVFDAGAGTIGAYRECAFATDGHGTFLPSEGAHPQVGRVGRTEQVEEARWETVVPASRVAACVRAYVDAHPYEEPAFDVYPLEDVAIRGGMGRVGSPAVRLSLVSLAETVAECFGLPRVTYAGDPERLIDRVALVTGSGGGLIEEASAVADVLITGDLRYHDADRAADLGMALIVVPHDHLESWALRRWAPTLREALKPWGVEVAYSKNGRSPWRQAHAVVRSKNGQTLDEDDRVVRLFDLQEAYEGSEGAEVTTPVPAKEATQEADPETYVLRVDGGSRGNPGPSAIGVVLEDAQGNVVEELGARIGHATNNVAEYQALLTGVETALDRGVRRLRILSDSLLLVRQLRQEYKVKNEGLKGLYFQARALISQFERVEIAHVPREQNTAADALVNMALDGKL
jgi:dinuclear metal center YbgI/SA1388 family protein